MDKTLLLLINRDWTNPALDSLMATITNFSVWLPLLVLAGVLLLWMWRRSIALTKRLPRDRGMIPGLCRKYLRLRYVL
jgi:hypothetical protein